jgi:hypothetical protein
MNRLQVLGSAALLGCGIAATPASAQSAGHILRGAGIGAAGGAVAGAIIPGLSVGNGALIGAAGGALYNTLIDKGHHRYYRSRTYYARRHYGSSSAEPVSEDRYRGYRHN